MPLIEAIPNFSEGQRPEIVAALVAAIQTPGVTVAGEPAAVCAGLFQVVATAARLIDLRRHAGVHPRLGATDVCPLVPIEGITLAECAERARQLGQRIGEELQLPVYLYEAAAGRPERVALPDVRRGGYEALINEIHLPHRQPDFGPAQVGPAGAVIVGARNVLVAYNIFLQSGDVAIARRIAHQIRERDGGLPAVRALGLLVDGQAQVSMNLTDVNRTPVHVAFARVAALAAEAGVAVERSELIGLAPQSVFLQAAGYFLKLADVTPGRTIEGRLRGE
jgi:glutamate formiminotransferase